MIPKTRALNLIPGDSTVVFLAAATDIRGHKWPRGTQKIPWRGGYDNSRHATCQQYTDGTYFVDDEVRDE